MARLPLEYRRRRNRCGGDVGALAPSRTSRALLRSIFARTCSWSSDRKGSELPCIRNQGVNGIRSVLETWKEMSAGKTEIPAPTPTQ